MSLSAAAPARARAILANTAGFARPIEFTDPSGATASVPGIVTDHSTAVDPETGVPVVARTAALTVSIAELADAGLGVPRGIASTASKPWLASFSDAQGAATLYRVAEALPDRTLGIVTCRLELYSP